MLKEGFIHTRPSQKYSQWPHPIYLSRFNELSLGNISVWLSPSIPAKSSYPSCPENRTHGVATSRRKGKTCYYLNKTPVESCRRAGIGRGGRLGMHGRSRWEFQFFGGGFRRKWLWLSSKYKSDWPREEGKIWEKEKTLWPVQWARTYSILKRRTNKFAWLE